MTQKEKIAQLEKEIAELKFKVSMLEARPMVITVTPQPAAYPTPGYTPPVFIGGADVVPLTVGNTGGSSYEKQNVCV